MKKFLTLFSLVVLPLLFMACGSDNDEPNYSNQTLEVGKVYAIPGGSNGWASDNELIASVSSSGVTAEHVGETYIRNGSKSFKVTVKAKYSTFKEPFMNFGASMSTVKSSMSSYTLNKELSEALLYDGKFPVWYYMYTFKNSGLYLSSAIIKAASVDTEEMVAFMNERYVYVTKDEAKYYFAFISPDMKTMVILQLDTMNSQVVYEIIYAEYTGSSSAPAQTMKQLKQKLAPTATEAGADVKAKYSRMLNAMPEMKTEMNITD